MLDEEEQQDQANGADQQPASIQSIATQAAAAMAAAMVAQQLLASAAATCGLDLTSLSNFAIMAASQSNNQANSTGPQTPEQLMAAAVAAASFLSHTANSNNLNNLNNNANQLNSNPSLNTLPTTILPEDLTTLGANGAQQQLQPPHNHQQQHQQLELKHHLNALVANNGQNSNNTNNFNNNNNSSSNNTLQLDFNSNNPFNQHHLNHLNLNLNLHQAAAAAAAAAATANNLHSTSNNGPLSIQEITQNQSSHRHSSSSSSSANSNSHQNHNSSNNNNNNNSNHHHHHHQTRHLLGHHHHSSIQTQQQLLATKGYNPLAVVGSGQQTEILTPTHLRKAKLMFFYVRYPNSSTLKECFRDVRFNKNNTAQLVKWFSNFREFYYIQMEKFARDAINDERIECKEDIVVTYDHELINVLNNHYNKNRHIELPEVFRQVVEETLRHFFDAIHTKRDQEQSWKKAIYKIIARLDQEVPELFKTDAFNEHLE